MKKRYSYTATINGLRYIAKSPAPEYGGFNYETVKIAQAALHYLTHPQESKTVVKMVKQTEAVKMVEEIFRLREALLLYHEAWNGCEGDWHSAMKNASKNAERTLYPEEQIKNRK